MSADLPVGHSWHGFACPGIQAECSYPVEREAERTCHESSTPILRGHSTWHRNSWRQGSSLGQHQNRTKSRGPEEGEVFLPNLAVKCWVTLPQGFSKSGLGTSTAIIPGDCVRNLNSQAPQQTNQRGWGSPAICALTSPPMVSKAAAV